MGRTKMELDEDVVYDLISRGVSLKEMAPELGISVPTLSARIADIQAKQGLLLQYRAIQNLQLTELQARCLEAITPEKIEEAPLKDLIVAYKILKDKELVDTGRPTDIKGLMHYLIQMEKEEMALSTEVETEEGREEREEIVDAIFKEDLKVYTPQL